jgi:hypothetical protein
LGSAADFGASTLRMWAMTALKTLQNTWQNNINKNNKNRKRKKTREKKYNRNRMRNGSGVATA